MSRDDSRHGERPLDRPETLMQAGLDGTLTGRERAELNRILLEHPETRALYEDLQRVDGLVRELPVVTPPEDLMNDVMRSAPARAATAVTTKASRPRRHLGLLAAAFAGGAVLTGLLFQTLMHSPEAVDPRQLAGTMAARPEAAGGPLGTVRLTGAQAAGSAALYRAGDELWVELVMDSRAPWELEATYDPAVADLLSVSRPEGELVPFEVAPGSVRFAGDQGRGTYRLYLASPGEKAVTLGLALTASGQRVAEGTLSAAPESGQ